MNDPVLADLDALLALFSRAAATREQRFAVRALRLLRRWRRCTPSASLLSLFSSYLAALPTPLSPLLTRLSSFLPPPSSSPSDAPPFTPSPLTPAAAVAFVHAASLVVRVSGAASPAVLFPFLRAALDAALRLDPALDPLVVQLLSSAARAAEAARVDSSPALLAVHRTATLRGHRDTATAAANELLRARLVLAHDPAAAALLSEQTPLPPGVPAPIRARRHYYDARIAALRLQYSQAEEFLRYALRYIPPPATKSAANTATTSTDPEKTPKNPSDISREKSKEKSDAVEKTTTTDQTAENSNNNNSKDDDDMSYGGSKKIVPGIEGFRVACTVLLLMVRMLSGDVPERAAFAAAPYRPYRSLAAALRTGDLGAFEKALAEGNDVFLRDGTLSLARRLRHNVQKTALRSLCAAYSRISIADVAARLCLSEADCEYVVARAVRDGVVAAEIDKKAGCIVCREVPDVFSTTRPQAALDRRIRYAMQLQEEARKAMRFERENDPAKKRLDEARSIIDKIHDIDLDDLDDLDDFYDDYDDYDE